MELSAYSTLDDEELRCIINIFFTIETLSGRPKRKALKNVFKSIMVGRHSSVARTIETCFGVKEKGEKKETRKERLEKFISAMSIVLKE